MRGASSLLRVQAQVQGPAVCCWGPGLGLGAAHCGARPTTHSPRPTAQRGLASCCPVPSRPLVGPRVVLHSCAHGHGPARTPVRCRCRYRTPHAPRWICAARTGARHPAALDSTRTHLRVSLVLGFHMVSQWFPKGHSGLQSGFVVRCSGSV